MICSVKSFIRPSVRAPSRLGTGLMLPGPPSAAKRHRTAGRTTRAGWWRAPPRYRPGTRRITGHVSAQPLRPEVRLGEGTEPVDQQRQRDGQHRTDDEGHVVAQLVSRVDEDAETTALTRKPRASPYRRRGPATSAARPGCTAPPTGTPPAAAPRRRRHPLSASGVDEGRVPPPDSRGSVFRSTGSSE